MLRKEGGREDEKLLDVGPRDLSMADRWDASSLQHGYLPETTNRPHVQGVMVINTSFIAVDLVYITV